jgi:hypothetical protein
VSSTEYFLQLLRLQAIDWLRLPLFQGLATSAVAGAEGLVRSTRLALVQTLSSYGGTEQQIEASAILKDLGVILSENLHDDRYAIPSMEFAAFLVDGYVSSVPEGSEPRCVIDRKSMDASADFDVVSESSSYLCKRHTSRPRIWQGLKLQSKSTRPCAGWNI